MTAVELPAGEWEELMTKFPMTRRAMLAGTAAGAATTMAPNFAFAAVSMLGVLPMILVVGTMQRFIVRGISMGAVKG